MMNLSMRTHGPVPSGPVGADDPNVQGAITTPGGWEKQVVKRLGNPPLRFTGRRLCLHWRYLNAEQPIEIAVWERRQKGFVLGHPRLHEGQVRADAAQLKTLGDAADFLEDLCQADLAAPSGEEPLLNLLSSLHVRLRFQQQFALLVGEVLDHWDAMLAAHPDALHQKEPFQ